MSNAEMHGESEPSAAVTVDFVFKVLGATYGAAWDRSLGTAPIQDVKTVWGDALSDFVQTKELRRCIAWALKNLPDTAPNARQFRSLCRNAPREPVIALPAPVVVNPEIAARVLDGLRGGAPEPAHRLDWARKILADVAAGMKRSPTVVKMAKDALGVAA